jgi:hypothetical protein
MKKMVILGIIFMVVSVVFLCGCNEQSSNSNTDNGNTNAGTIDTDGDGYNDDVDAFPNDSSEWKDSDNDGVGDNSDWAPNNPYEQYDSDNDGVGDNSDRFKYESTQWADRDGDGYGDNLNGNNPDLFPDDINEWRDSDSDGIGDNSDIYDSGNGGIRVHVTEFHCDNPGDEFFTSPDPYILVYLTAWPEEGETDSYNTKSAIYWDEVDVGSMLYWSVDVDDDIERVSLQIDAYDDDDWTNDEIIDIDGNYALAQGIFADFYPRDNAIQSYNDDGRLDFVDDQFDGWLEFTIEVVPI